MRLLINTSLLRFGGAVQVALSFIRECRSFDEHEYHVVLGSGVGAAIDQADFPSNFHFHQQSFGAIGLRKLLRVQREMGAIERKVCPDCVVTTSGPSFWRSQAPHLVGFNRFLDIYPESPYVQSLRGIRRVRREAYRQIHRWFYRRDADALIVQTDDVNCRAREWLGIEAVHTVSNTHSSFYLQHEPLPPRLAPIRDGVFRFVTVTSFYPHKNLEIIPEVLQTLHQQGTHSVEFVLTLTPDEYREKVSPCVPDGLHLIGPVPPDECPSLYEECDGMFLPTLAECFSASYPEAMVTGKPIVTTDLGFARSICGPAAMYFEPCNALDAARAVTALMRDEALQERLRGEGRRRLALFDSPARRAAKILDICATLAAKTH